MEYLLAPTNIKVLESFAIVHTIYGFDFDGTLAPIVRNPSDACMNLKVASQLHELNSKVPVAIITGRSVSDIKPRLNFDPLYLIGNHGMEGFDGPVDANEHLRNCENLKFEILGRYQKEFQSLGITLEDKKYSLTVHYRNSSRIGEAQDFLAHTLVTLPGAKVSGGKMVYNILPSSGSTKGEAFLRILKEQKSKFGFYIGDDETDEDVFRNKDPNILSVKVGWTPHSHARFFVKDQSEVETVVTKLLEFHKAHLVHNQVT